MERAHRTHAEEFYQVYDGDLEIMPLNHALQAWERTYKTLSGPTNPWTGGHHKSILKSATQSLP